MWGGRNELKPDFLADVAFIGHCEADWRIDCLNAIAVSGYKVIIKGGGWDHAIGQCDGVKALLPITHAFGAEYNHIYANVIVGLCFFSKINNDSWTSRAFEIIAVGGLLVCERTEEAKTYFVDRQEAYFFSSIAELVEIIAELKSNLVKREAIRAAGYARLLDSKHAIGDRAVQIKNVLQRL